MSVRLCCVMAHPVSGCMGLLRGTGVTGPVVDSASGTFGVRLEVANPDGSLLAGVKCVADF